MRRELDLSLIVAMAMMIAFGVTMVYSAAGDSDVWRNQALFALMSLVVAVAIVYVPDKLFYDLAYPLYVLGLLSLLAVLVWGTGTPARWLSIGSARLQPSEFAKIATIMAIARFLGDQSVERVSGPRAVGLAVLLTALPMSLVARQPDLGTAVSFGAVLVPMLYWAGMRPLHVFFLAAPLLSVVFSFEPLWQDQAPIVFALFIIVSSVIIQLQLARLWVTLTMLGVNLSAGLVTTYLWANFLRGYQKARIMTFLDPESDPLGWGWNIIQSKIAIGSGGPTGKGFLEGTQTNYEFLPAAHTDFIFSVIGEELGFVGAVFVLSLFLFMIWRSLYIGTIANNRFASLVAVGMASMLTFHVFVNVGMTIGVMPVTGLPLPFLSYGGSSLLTNCIALGLLLHIYAHRHEY
ncbi:MAG: rod shape-determining protein RodA [Candidatus Latescibacterota bacterium]|jgi:rod shape determining protein RodA|nr:rod shape-determining protein RodA [Candidatus Latescibacterota bacterium]